MLVLLVSYAEVEVVQERIFLETHVNESRIEAGHELLHLGNVEITNGIGSVARLLLERHEAAILKQGGGYFVGSDVDYKIAAHSVNRVREG